MSASHGRRRFLQAGIGLGAGAVLGGVGAGPGGALSPTPTQELGPFYPDTPQADTDFDLTRIAGANQRAEGEVIHVAGVVRNQQGAPLPGTVVEVWQANSHGRYAHERDTSPLPLDAHFQGRAVLTTDAEGRFAFTTIRPGRYAISDREGAPSRTPHIHFRVALRGHQELIAQMYFADEGEANALDTPYRLLTPEERALSTATLLAAGGSGPKRFTFDVTLEELVDPRALGVDLALYTGRYADEERSVVIHERDGQLYFDLAPFIADAQLRPLAPNRFRVAGLPAGSTMEFTQPDAGQPADGMVVSLRSGRELRFMRQQ